MDTNVYESGKLLNEYLLFHYGTEEDIFAQGPGPREALGFAVRSVTSLLDPALLPQEATALDIGCAVGRSTFELARFAETVLGIDFSHRFIAAADTLKRTGCMRARRLEEGLRFSDLDVHVPPEIPREKATFHQGDAMNLPAHLPAADIVLAANLICRLRQPESFLTRLPSLVRPGGQLLLTTPFTWLEEFTPVENWLGGQEGHPSFEALSAALSPDFELQHTVDLPFVIREHSRKFQYGIALGSRWIRRR